MTCSEAIPSLLPDASRKPRSWGSQASCPYRLGKGKDGCGRLGLAARWTAAGARGRSSQTQTAASLTPASYADQHRKPLKALSRCNVGLYRRGDGQSDFGRTRLDIVRSDMVPAPSPAEDRTSRQERQRTSWRMRRASAAGRTWPLGAKRQPIARRDGLCANHACSLVDWRSLR